MKLFCLNKVCIKLDLFGRKLQVTKSIFKQFNDRPADRILLSRLCLLVVIEFDDLIMKIGLNSDCMKRVCKIVVIMTILFDDKAICNYVISNRSCQSSVCAESSGAAACVITLSFG